MLLHYLTEIEQLYRNKIRVELPWLVVALITVIAIVGYAVYCTWSGGVFAGNIQIGIPTLIHVQFSCSR